MKMINTITVLLFALLIIEANADEFRTWTSASGKHKTEARLLEITEDGKTVVLWKTDNKESRVPLTQLSKSDQEYVKQCQEKMKEVDEELPREEKEPKKASTAQGWEERDRLREEYRKKREQALREQRARQAQREELQRAAAEGMNLIRRKQMAQRHEALTHMFGPITASMMTGQGDLAGELKRKTVSFPRTTTLPTKPNATNSKPEQQKQKCYSCNGTGTKTEKCPSCQPSMRSNCTSCQGTGKRQTGLSHTSSGPSTPSYSPCMICGGTGLKPCQKCKDAKSVSSRCNSCSGKGYK